MHTIGVDLGSERNIVIDDQGNVRRTRYAKEHLGLLLAQSGVGALVAILQKIDTAAQRFGRHARQCVGGRNVRRNGIQSLHDSSLPGS